MNSKATLTTVGTSLAASLVAIGVVAFSASAQTTAVPSTPGATNPGGTQAAPANPGAPTPSGTPEANEGRGPGFGGKHGHGGFGGPGGFEGPGGFGGRGGYGFGGRDGQNLTADMVNNQITRATDILKTANTDLTYATGKMDTANIQKWLTDANTWVKNAQTAVTGTKLERAVEDTQVAEELARVAESQMAQTLGVDKLPSYSQRPQGRMGGKGMMPGMGTTATAPTQAQASRLLAATYNRVVSEKSLVKSADATPYLTEAQSAYATAYAAYNAGKYTDAVQAARLAEQLAGVSVRARAASDAPDSTNTVVTVPAPTF